MIILVGLDDTIESMLHVWIDRVNKKYGTNVVHEDITNWDISKAFDGLTWKQVYGTALEEDFWEGVELLPGAEEGLKHFIEKGHEVYIVTATPYQSVSIKIKEILGRCLPFISWSNVIITSRKQMIKGDVLIDDGPHNLEGGSYAKILVDAPYNREYDAEGHGMIRVHNWKEIEEAVDRIEAGKREVRS